MTITNHLASLKKKPILIGVFAVLGVLAVGVSLAIATGYVSPQQAFAQVFDGPPCCTIPPTPPLPPPGDVFDGPPCCTTPPIVPVPPILPPILPPVLPPVTPPLVPSAQCVFLSASATTITPGQSVALSWETVNATSITINHGIGVVTPTASGSIVVNPTTSTTYVATVTGATGSVNCEAAVTVSSTPPPPAQCVFLTGTPSVINAGDPVNLTWKTLNATAISIDNGVGSVTPVAEGSVIVHPTGNTTYVATVTGATGSVNCQTSVVVTTIEQGPACVSLTASASRIRSGDPVTLTWITTNAASISIDNGIGAVTPVGIGSVVVNPTANTTYTASVPGAVSNPGCQATVEIETGGGSCTSNCGGGGGGGNPRPHVLLSALKAPADQSFVYLSQIPYTGLDLGPWGTALYWIMLVLWSLAAAYLIFFNALPLAYRKVGVFGGSVREVLKQPVVTYAPAMVAVTEHVAHSAPVHEPSAPAVVDETPSAYQAHDGFRSFAAGSMLTIDDIVKGLAREAQVRPTASAHDIRPDFLAQEEPVMQAEPLPAYVPEAPATVSPFNEDVRTFIESLLKGDRDAVFGTIRGITRTGGDSEAFLTHAVCALDDAYRARVDGSVCHPDILAVTADCHPSFLERMVTALTTAVDGSYSTGVTGVKLAVTRALAIANG